MGFISFNEQYYKRRLEILENKILSADDLYEAKQLLKVLDDLQDEGYTKLNNRMEKDFSCLTRLRKLIGDAGETPFAVGQTCLPETGYAREEHELTALVNKLARDAGGQALRSEDPFLKDVYGFCDWIGYEEDADYVFLFRDALLPYLYFTSRKRRNTHAWLIGRRFIADMTGKADTDDALRLPIYEALESGYIDFAQFSAFCKDRMRSVLNENKALKETLLGLLDSVKGKRIIAVESGYCGTVPMMLGSLDDRVTFRMYTTAPFLYETYKDHIYCRRYEDIRKFERLYSQDLCMQYASCHDGRFYVRMSESPEVRNRSLAELKCFLK